MIKKKYMFFDIDGTLTSGLLGHRPIISQETKQALHDLKAAGHFLAIATGRPYFMSRDIAEEVQITNIVCNGGNDVYLDGHCYQEEPLDHSLALSIIHQCLEKEIAFCVSIRNDLVRYTHTEDFAKLIEGKHFLGELVIDPAFAYDEVGEYKRMYIDNKRIKEIDFQGMMIGSSYQEVYAIVEPDDKYHGIETMMKLLQAPLEDVVVFGDGNNDIRMFEKAAMSIAMGNGVEPLKQIADFVTHRSDEDGIRFACEHFGWL